MLVATGGSIAVWTTEQDTRGVLVAARELPAGTTLTANDIQVARARLDDAVYAATVPAESLSGVIGRQLAEPVHANQLLIRAQVSNRPRLAPDEMVLALPVRADTAAGGRIRAGDSVQVLSSQKDGLTHVLLQRVTVYEVGRDSTASTSSSSSTNITTGTGNLVWVTLIVNSQQAQELAQARYSSNVDLALLPPPPTPT